MMDPADVLVDLDGAAAGGIMILGQMLLKHPLAKVRIVPGDVIALAPGERVCRPTNDVK
jgi:hypothetical protein